MRLDAVIPIAFTLINQIHDHFASAITTRCIPVPDDEPKALPPVSAVKTFEGKKEENLPLWLKVVEMASSSAIQTDKQKVGLAILKLGARARK